MHDNTTPSTAGAAQTSTAAPSTISLDAACRLPPITLFGLVGPAGAGKDTVADYLQARYDYLLNRLKLKQSVSSLSRNDLEDLAELLK